MTRHWHKGDRRRLTWDGWIAVLAVIIAVGTVGYVLVVVAAQARSKPRFHTSVASVFSASGESELGCASGRRYQSEGYVVAHKTLPCGTRIKFCKHRCAWARVADRGPYGAGRTWDLDTALAARIGFPYSVTTVHWRRAR